MAVAKQVKSKGGPVDRGVFDLVFGDFGDLLMLMFDSC
jgi:hypothetical protein